MFQFPRQLILILAVAAAMYFSVDFSKRLETLTQLSAKESALDLQIKTLEGRQAELKGYLKQILRPEFAEKIAREYYRWAREGDTVVATQKSAAPAPPPMPAPAPPAPRKEWWQEIFDFLFGP